MNIATETETKYRQNADTQHTEVENKNHLMRIFTTKKANVEYFIDRLRRRIRKGSIILYN